jgi:hypothetical protein
MDPSFVRGLMGPVGSGKSSTCCVDIVMKALKQAPDKRGVRRSRWAVIRNTYPELKSTTIKTWQAWFPDNIAPIKWDSPITSMMKIKDVGDGTGLELEVIFLALDRPTETGKLRSLELTGGWINEASEVPQEIFDMLTQRVGRFPAKRDGGPSWSGVLLDTNPPDDDHWYYNLAENEKPKGYAFFRQPGALYREGEEYKANPDAENVDNLPNGYEYYFRQVPGKKEEWVNVFLLGEYGTTADGKPVYPEYRDAVHVAKEDQEAVRGLPILLGWDFGLTPSCIVGQLMPNGQLRILDEYIAEDMGIRQFANDVVKPELLNKYAGFSRISTGDPAGNIRVQTDEKTCLNELAEAGIITEPAETNDFIPRREAVAYFLTRIADGVPGFVINPRCSVLRKGFNGRYHYERLKTSGPARYKDRPYKDQYSHPHDALQYLALRIRTGLHKPKAKPVVQTGRARAYT